MNINVANPGKKEKIQDQPVSDVEEPSQGEGKLENTPDKNQKYAQASTRNGEDITPEKDQKSEADPIQDITI